jgi:hypothetical protein
MALAACGGAAGTRKDDGPPPPPAADAAPPTPAAPTDAKERVDAYLAALGGPAPDEVAVLADDALARTFPSLAFVAVRWGQWPVGVSPAKGLASSNVLVVAAGGPPTPISSKGALEAFFATTPRAAGGDAARAFLVLAHALAQDGYYAFEIVESDGAHARSLVTHGGNGSLEVRLGPGPADVTSTWNLHPGPRPRCQATKLLDPDPIVRFMAERDLEFLGRSALPYLRAQRERAAPPLRDAIDSMIRRIEAAGW